MKTESPDIYPSEMDLLLNEDQCSINDEEELEGGEEEEVQEKRRNLIAYWILGLCNNYGYVVMLSAAHDILSGKGGGHNATIPNVNNSSTSNPRDCNSVSTGAILLADILPALAIKLLAPFLPFHVHLRVMAVMLLSVLGFVLVAASKTSLVAILGVVATSLASGLGEVTFMSYSSFFQSTVVSTWASGTGGAGVFGSLSYAGLTSLGLSPSTSIYIMLIVPALMGVTFWGILKHPSSHTVTFKGRTNKNRVLKQDQHQEQPVGLKTLKDKIKAIPPLFKFMIPLLLVYFFEYFINQGLFELIYFSEINMDHHEQYRWYQVDYQIGVFISRSSLALFQIKKLWILAVLQGINVIFFTYEVISYFLPSIWIVFIIVFWEGLLGGASYVNTFYQVSKQIAPEKREFSLGITCLSDAIGIALAGFAAIPAHNFLCSLPLYK